ncbi:triose-phosphate isomerase [Coraliomargarita akajimensis]|uniref:Triosephosphate isomerase n=1 Tax=Coraliomargarita akajimensis (strain DSM 45221 / IAM 15411 / JCM 23193 / KCTC 12865 / 04OKA010-24) TaxID=583355 RepID=D5ERG2_CORAD|nr:triose-phosphate isomerase [Coraliomargarita akajimensis]ADE56006.1 triosephosphate isomerase [Coraliomargarita akajimensis DSM 45221]
MSRKYLIAGNWKMNLVPAEGAALVKEIAGLVGSETAVDICVSPTFTALDAVSKEVAGSQVTVGAQNMHFEASGAYTGEISADMLKAVSVQYVILGHSERREYFGETDADVNKKTIAALAAGLKPIVCVGETLEEREAGKVTEVIKTQTEAALAGVTAAQADELVIAYEPVWAIGTGKTATPEMAEEVHAEIRCLLAGLLGEEAAEKVRILYGGSMKPENADDLLAQKNIDGGLIGGASLKAPSFASLVESAAKLS